MGFYGGLMGFYGGFMGFYGIYLLLNQCNSGTIHHFDWENSLSMAILNGYVSLPEGTFQFQIQTNANQHEEMLTSKMKWYLRDCLQS